MVAHEGEPIRCARHPQRTTLLRCAKCDVPICLACAVQTPVGVRCPGCAQTGTVPFAQIGVARSVRGAVAGLAVGLAGGALVSGFLRGLFAIWLAPVFGFLVGEAVARGSRGGRGRDLQIVAAGAVVIGTVLGPALPAIAAGLPVGPAIAAAVILAGSDLWIGIFGLLAVVFAVQRLR